MGKWTERLWRLGMWSNFTIAIVDSFVGKHDVAAYCIGLGCFSALQLVLGKGERHVVNNITVNRSVSDKDFREAIRRHL